jgi:hypothetical protein
VRKNYPTTNAGLRRMGRDMQKELEKGMKPVRVPVTYRVTGTARTVSSGSSWPVAGDTVNNNYYGDQHYGDNVSVDGDGNVVAVGNQGPVNQSIGAGQSDDEWRMALLEALGNVQGHLDDLDLDDDDRDTIQDAAVSAAALAASENDNEGEVDDALHRRGKRVLGILEKIGTAASGGVIAHSLAGPLQQLLS